jgi:hypothetical protein
VIQRFEGQLTCDGDDQVQGKEHEAFHIIRFSVPEIHELGLHETEMWWKGIWHDQQVDKEDRYKKDDCLNIRQEIRWSSGICPGQTDLEIVEVQSQGLIGSKEMWEWHLARCNIWSYIQPTITRSGTTKQAICCSIVSIVTGLRRTVYAYNRTPNANGDGKLIFILHCHPDWSDMFCSITLQKMLVNSWADKTWNIPRSATRQHQWRPSG